MRDASETVFVGRPPHDNASGHCFYREHSYSVVKIVPLTSEDPLTRRRPQRQPQQQQRPRHGGDDDQRSVSPCTPANFYGRPPKNEEGILVSPLSSGGDCGGKRKLKSSRRVVRPLSLPPSLPSPQFPFMGELFSYLNVAETAPAARAMCGNDDELLRHTSNIIEDGITEASSMAQVLG